MGIHSVFHSGSVLFISAPVVSGAHPQIFMVFASFLLVEKFNYSAASIFLLFLANHVLTIFFVAKVERWINIINQRHALSGS